MLLTMLNIGETGKIKRIGGNEETRRFLNNLGFVVGTEVSVVSAIGGNVIVNIKDIDTSIAILLDPNAAKTGAALPMPAGANA